MSDQHNPKRFLVDRRNVATYYAKERRDLLAMALQEWRLLDGKTNIRT